MTTYRYEGMTSSGAKVDGIIEAFDEQDALARAKQNCRVVTKVVPVTTKGTNLLNADIGELLFGIRIKDKDLALLCSQLSIELKAGLPLVRSLQLVADNAEDKNIKKLMTQVADDVHSGHGLADSFELRGPYLPSTFIETVRAGEESGRLDDCFIRLQKYFENAAAVSSKVGSAMVYPIMLICVAVVVIFIIMIKAVPVFENSFASLGNELPGPTQLLINMSHFMTDNWMILLAVVAALALGLKFFGKTERGATLYARIMLTFPGIGMMNIMSSASNFCATLATMLSAGLPLVQAATITADTTTNLLISRDIRDAINGVIAGQRLGDGMKKSKWFPNLLLEMIAVGEETGNMEETLNVVGDYYTKEVDVAVQRALGILEPCITLVLAVLVVFILLSVYMPLFTMYGSV